MRLIRLLFISGLVGFLAACAGSGPQGSALDQTTRDSVRIDAVIVDITDLGPTTEGQKVSTQSVKDILEREAADLIGEGRGPIPTRLVIDLEMVNLISAAQSIMIGGESVMKGTVTLVDARDGKVIIPATKIDAGGGGWVLGGIVGAATRDDPATELSQMSAEFIDRARVLVFGI